jgi:hypothetical protein
MVRWSAANAHRQIARKVDWSLTFHGFLRREIAEELRRRAPERRGLGDTRNAGKPMSQENFLARVAFGLPLTDAPAPSSPETGHVIDIAARRIS